MGGGWEPGYDASIYLWKTLFEDFQSNLSLLELCSLSLWGERVFFISYVLKFTFLKQSTPVLQIQMFRTILALCEPALEDRTVRGDSGQITCGQVDRGRIQVPMLRIAQLLALKLKLWVMWGVKGGSSEKRKERRGKERCKIVKNMVKIQGESS